MKHIPTGTSCADSSGEQIELIITLTGTLWSDWQLDNDRCSAIRWLHDGEQQLIISVVTLQGLLRGYDLSIISF